MLLRLRRFGTYRLDLFAVVLLIGLSWLGNWHALTPVADDQWSISGGDFTAHSLVYSSYAASRLSRGETPLWWPNNYAGQPFFADPEAAAAYPVRLLMIAASGGHWGYGMLQAEAVLHLLIASLLMYACARTLGAGYVGAVAAALLFAHSGFLNGYPIQQLHILESAVWLPLVIALIHRARGSPALLMAAGGALGLAFLAGHTQTALYEIYVAVAYLAYRARVEQKAAWISIALQVALLGTVAFLVSAVALLPAAEFLPRTTRDAEFDFAAKSGGMGFGALVQAVYPGVVSLFSPLYVGVTGLLLAAAGLKARFWAGVALVSGLFAFGASTVLFSAAYWALPGVSMFRNPERALSITVFAVALLGGFGVRRIIDGRLSQTAWRWLVGASAALTAATGLIAVGVTLALLTGAAGNPAGQFDAVWYALLVSAAASALLWRTRSAARPLLVGLALVTLVGWDLLSWTTAHPSAFQPAPLTSQLPRPAYVDSLESGAWRVDGARALTPYASLYGQSDIYGVSPLRLTSMSHLLELPVDRFWDLLAVRYVVSEHDSLPTPSHRIAEGDDAGGHYYVYEIDQPRPFAWLVYHAEVNADPVFARQIIADSRFDPRSTVIVPQAPPLALSGVRPAEASAQITQYSPETIEIVVDTPENAVLTLAQPYYPGWQASIDGASTQITEAYTALSAVYVPTGHHTVTLRFVPYSVFAGAALSGIGWLAVLAALVQWRLRQKA